MNDDQRGNWYLLTGLVIGIMLGLVIAWVIAPVTYVDTDPASLRADYKDAYRVAVALAYISTGDLERARARLDLLHETAVPELLAAQAQRYLAAGRPMAEVQALGLLAAALGEQPTPLSTTSAAAQITESLPSATFTAQPTHTPSPTLTSSPTLEPTGSLTTTQEGTPGQTRTPRPSATPTSTPTPRPTATPTATLGAPYVLLDKEKVCDPALTETLIQVITLDAAGEQVPGVMIIINYDEREEVFFTGLKPDYGLGYADYTMTPGVTYAIHVADGGELVTDLAAHECTDTESGTTYWGGWLVRFTQP